MFHQYQKARPLVRRGQRGVSDPSPSMLRRLMMDLDAATPPKDRTIEYRVYVVTVPEAGAPSTPSV
jgi:hypothetical protein